MRSNQWRRLSRALAFAAALALAACAFSSERAYFSARDAVYPFPDGSIYRWRVIGGGEQEDRDITFRREGVTYAMSDPKEDEPMRGLMFVRIGATRAEDYVVQMQRPDEENATYGFVWRDGQSYRVFVDPGMLRREAGDAAMDRYCTRGQYNECALKGRDALLRLYRTTVYQRYVRTGVAPEEYLELTPLPAAGER